VEERLGRHILRFSPPLKGGHVQTTREILRRCMSQNDPPHVFHDFRRAQKKVVKSSIFRKAPRASGQTMYALAVVPVGSCFSPVCTSGFLPIPVHDPVRNARTKLHAILASTTKSLTDSPRRLRFWEGKTRRSRRAPWPRWLAGSCL